MNDYCRALFTASVIALLGACTPPATLRADESAGDHETKANSPDQELADAAVAVAEAADSRVAFYRFYGTFVNDKHQSVGYHWYTTNCDEIRKLGDGRLIVNWNNRQYLGEGLEGYVYSAPVEGSKPLYRLWNGIFTRYLWDENAIREAETHPRPAIKDPPTPIGYVLPPGDEREGTQNLKLWIEQVNSEDYFYSTTDPLPEHVRTYKAHGPVMRVWTEGSGCPAIKDHPSVTPGPTPEFGFCMCYYANDDGSRRTADYRKLTCKTDSQCSSRCRGPEFPKYMWTGGECRK